jgi:autotransporter-associated beta strand protein
MSITSRTRLNLTVSAMALTMAMAAGSAQAQIFFPPKAAYQALPSDPTSIIAGPHAFYIAPIASLYATQANLGWWEVGKKGANDTPPYGKDAGYYPIDGLTPSSVLPYTPGPNYDTYMLGQTTPVVIGPGGKLYATDKQHTDFAVYQGYKNVPGFTPYAYILVTANYSNQTEAQFEQTMTNQGLVLLENKGVPITFAQLPGSLLNVGNDPYRSLQYEVIKNKWPLSSLSKAALVGTDKALVPYYEFLAGDAYRKAGLRYRTGADADYAAGWSQNAANYVDAKTSKLMPSFILPKNTLLNVTQNITTATLGASGTAAIDDKGGFNGLVTYSGGVPDWSGLLIQTGNDLGGVVQLSGNNTYKGGTVILDGTLRISSDANLGDPSGMLLFRSVAEGNGTLQAAANLTINRNIDVGSETATLDPAGYQVTINGVISGTQALTIANQGNSPGNGSGGTVTLTGSNTTEGDIAVKNGITLQISSDANLGNNNYSNDPNGYYVGALDLSGKAVVQTLAAINSKRPVNVTGNATINPFGFSSTWGTVNVTDSTLTIGNVKGAAASASTVTNLTTLNVNDGAILSVDNTNAGVGNNTAVNIGTLNRNPVVANYVTNFNSTLVLNSVTGALVTSGAGETVTATNAPKVSNGIVDPWIVGQVGKSTNPYDFLTYNNGFKTATYTSTNIATSGATDVVASAGASGVTAAVHAYALKLGATLSGTGALVLGNGSNPAGLILNGGALNLASLNVSASELIVTTSGTSTINAAINGTNGLTVNGSGSLTLGSKESVTGSVSLTGSGTTTLGAVDTLASAQNGINLGPNATLQLKANNAIASLNGAGTVVLGANTLTVGIAGDNVYSLSNAKVGAAGDGGSMIVSGPATLELTGGSINYSGTTTVNAGATLRIAAKTFAYDASPATAASAGGAGDIVLNGGTIMFDQGGGGIFKNNITGTGDLKLISGSVSLAPNKANTYTGGTNIFFGGVLYASTAALPTGSNIHNDGTLVIDQNFAGTWNGVISDYNRPGYGMVYIDDSLDAYNCPAGSTATSGCTTTTANGGTPYTQKATGNVTFATQQAYTGATVINYGTLTLGAVDAIKASSGVTIEPNATLALGANNQIASLASEGYTTTPAGGSVLLNGYTLTVGDSRNISSEYDGSVTGANGSLVKAGGGALKLTGAISGLNVAAIGGGTLDLASGASLSAVKTNVNGGVLEIDAGSSLKSATLNIGAAGTVLAPAGSSVSPTTAVANAGLLNIQNGSATNVVTLGSYNGQAGSQISLGVNPGAGTADRLVVGSVSGGSQIILNAIGATTPATYNPTGIALVTSANPFNPSSFTLAGGPVQRGLFQYDLAYNPDPAIVLVSVPTAAAYRLDTVPTAARSIFLDTASIWTDRQANLRDMLTGFVAPAPKIVKGPLPPEQPTPSASLWATGFGDWASRSETQNYNILNKFYAFDTGYQLNSTAVFAGLDASLRNVLGPSDAVLLGVNGGYINSTQKFHGATASAAYEGGSVGVSASYVSHGWFADALLKGDFLTLRYSDLAVAAFGAGRTTSNVQTYGVIVDGGYRFEFGATNRSFIEPIATFAYVSTNVGGLNMGGAQIGFGGDDLAVARIGLRGGAMLWLTDSWRVDGYATAGYWGRLAGSSTALINTGVNAPLLTVTDRPINNSGDVGLNLNIVSLTNSWSGFVKGDYQFASGFNAGTIKGGISYNF